MKIYMAKDGLHIEGSKANLTALRNTCSSALQDGKAIGIIPAPYLGLTAIYVEVKDDPETKP